MNKPIYVLGTGLSHDGSTCLLKDGKIIVAIEKERLSRRKHDGGNDSLTVQYCLDQAGISIEDLSLVVQTANFEKETIRKEYYRGNRLFAVDCRVPFVTISHHLAHAYSAIGTSPFDECNVLVIDGSGSFYNQCDDLENAFVPNDVKDFPGQYAETNSFYFFKDRALRSLYKDFSPIKYEYKQGEVFLPTTRHSIGGLYAMAAKYCFGDFDQAGKLMGLAPYGNPTAYKEKLFILREGRVWVNEAAMHSFFNMPADDVERSFKNHFQYYADIARWVQDETEKAILYLVNNRLQMHPHQNLCYAGGVALNAVTNTKILQLPGIKNLYIEPAAGDNGLAVGCAYYGWLKALQKEKVRHSGSTFFGKNYPEKDIVSAIEKYIAVHPEKKISYRKEPGYITITAGFLKEGKTVGWFQLGAEFGPRALGRRSILANPAIKNIQQHINQHIKFREDFRPFAPAVLYEDAATYFEYGIESPYMILIDRIKTEWKNKLPGIVHVDGTCRVQTVRDKSEPFYQLLEAFKKINGIPVLLNTSFNCKGMPIVETADEAISFFYECGLDVLVLNDFMITK
jgi:carbamoyltransferase